MKMKEVLKSERMRRGLTQQDVADYLKISQPAYIRYEKGTAEPSVENLTKLAEKYNVTVDFLIGRVGFIEHMKQEFKSGMKTGEDIGDKIKGNKPKETKK